MNRTRRRHKRGLLKTGLPQARVRGLNQSENGTIYVDFGLDSTLIPAKRAQEFPLGKKFKLIAVDQ